MQMTNSRVEIEESHGSDKVLPNDVQALSNFVSSCVESFYQYAGTMPDAITLTVRDFGDKHSSTGYTS